MIQYKEQKDVDFPEREKTQGTSKKEDKVILKLFQRKSVDIATRPKVVGQKGSVIISIMTLKRRLNEANIF